MLSTPGVANRHDHTDHDESIDCDAQQWQCVHERTPTAAAAGSTDSAKSVWQRSTPSPTTAAATAILYFCQRQPATAAASECIHAPKHPATADHLHAGPERTSPTATAASTAGHNSVSHISTAAATAIGEWAGNHSVRRWLPGVHQSPAEHDRTGHSIPVHHRCSTTAAAHDAVAVRHASAGQHDVHHAEYDHHEPAVTAAPDAAVVHHHGRHSAVAVPTSNAVTATAVPDNRCQLDTVQRCNIQRSTTATATGPVDHKPGDWTNAVHTADSSTSAQFRHHQPAATAATATLPIGLAQWTSDTDHGTNEHTAGTVPDSSHHQHAAHATAAATNNAHQHTSAIGQSTCNQFWSGNHIPDSTCPTICEHAKFANTADQCTGNAHLSTEHIQQQPAECSAHHLCPVYTDAIAHSVDSEPGGQQFADARAHDSGVADARSRGGHTVECHHDDGAHSTFHRIIFHSRHAHHVHIAHDACQCFRSKVFKASANERESQQQSETIEKEWPNRLKSERTRGTG